MKASYCTEYNDETLMLWGKHKGKKLSEVPVVYLIWIYEKFTISHRLLRNYLELNIHAIRLRAKNEIKK